MIGSLTLFPSLSLLAVYIGSRILPRARFSSSSRQEKHLRRGGGWRGKSLAPSGLSPFLFSASEYFKALSEAGDYAKEIDGCMYGWVGAFEILSFPKVDRGFQGNNLNSAR